MSDRDSPDQRLEYVHRRFRGLPLIAPINGLDVFDFVIPPRPLHSAVCRIHTGYMRKKGCMVVEY